MKKLVLFLTVYIFLTMFAVDLGYNYFLPKVFKQDFIEINKEATEAPIAIIADSLSKMSVEEMHVYLKTFQDKYNYPIYIKNLDDISKYERPLLLKGELVTDVLGINNKMLVKGTKQVLFIGPIELDETPAMEAFVYITFIGTLILVNIIMAYVIWSQMMKLYRASTSFGEGDFSKRIKFSKLSFITEIATAFNNMADRIENLIKSNRELTNAVAHELRTPLARMKFELESIKESTTASDSVSGMEKDISELEELISQLLVYSRLDRQEDFLAKETVEINEWFESYFKQVRPISDKKFEWNLNHNCTDRKISIDKKLVSLAINNLIINGFKYCKSSVYADVACSEKDLVISVSDDGKGIDEGLLQDIFKPFKRTDSSRSKDTGGFGLGLAVVSKTIQMHNGDVSARNAKGSGLVVTIRLRLT